MSQPLERQRQMRSSARLEHRVDLIHNHCPHRPQHLATSLGREHQIQGFGSGDQDMRRLSEHGRPLGRRSVARANRRGNPGGLEPHLFGQPADLSPGLGQVEMDVGAQCLEG
jgi:hypothetical protein